MTTADTQDVVKPADSRNGEAGRLCVQRLVPQPFYDVDGITIYCGDNRQILPMLDACDLLLTDPPYGIGESSQRQRTRGLKPNAKWKNPAMKDYGHFDWDGQPADEWVMSLARSLCHSQIIWGGNYYDLPPTKCLLIWDKENDGKDQADCEIAWTNLPGATRRKRHLWDGFRQRVVEERYHPTQKPLAVISWALSLAGDVKTVLDPWMGSGTSLVAAKLAGMRAIGIEANETHCKTAVARLAQGVLGLGNGERSDGSEPFTAANG
jgi:site-specific DNA-methyltransferase (adenine-specific)/modification methylase